MYKGDYLANELYSWAYALRIKLKKEFKKLLLKAADYYIKQEELDEAVKLLEQVVKKDPLAEEAHKKLIEIYKEKGKKAAARQQYEELKAKLQEELGVEPRIEF